MLTFNRLILISLFSFCTSFSLFAYDWRNDMDLLIYSPRYFGPNAFPIPELREGLVTSRFEIEVRGEYHCYSGDKTKDLFLRIMLPIVKRKAAVEVTFIPKETYKMTPETRRERFAQETWAKYTGDVIFTGIYQIWKNEKWVDITGSMNFKTASGDRVADARFTDAASYWFDVTIGKDMLKSPSGNASLRMQGMFGFYCWMTNSMKHRQDDAYLYGIGFSGRYRNFTLMSNLSGFRGYENNGDRPLILRNNLQYEYKKNILSFRYHHGMKDRLYETYAISYTRCF